MILFPAIDVKDGQCVRLVQGDMQQVTIFNDDPAKQAELFVDSGFSWIHIVDLNGAFEGTPVNTGPIVDVLNSVKIPVQLGGGIRSMAIAEKWLNSGVSRIVLGTAAIKNVNFVREACKEFPGQVAIAIDSRSGWVAVDGWSELSKVRDIDLLNRFEDDGAAAIIYTDIERDGLLGGINISNTSVFARSTEIPIIASGGVSSIEDLKSLKTLEEDGIIGVISGRAIYDGRIDAKKALKFLEG